MWWFLLGLIIGANIGLLVACILFSKPAPQEYRKGFRNGYLQGQYDPFIKINKWV